MILFIWIYFLPAIYSVGVLFWEAIRYSLNFGFLFDVSIYGMSTDDSFSLMGLLIHSIIFYKAFTAYTMWTEKNIAMTLGIIDAIIGLIICVMMTIFYPIFELVGDGTYEINLRIEILFLIPYLIKCWKLQKPWKVLIEPIYSKVKPTPIHKERNSPKPDQKQNSSASPNSEKKSSKQQETEIVDKEDPKRFMPK